MNTILEQNQGRKIRRWFVYSISTILVLVSVGGILYGLHSLILPFIMGAFLAYLFKPLTKKFQSSHWTKYVKLAVVLGLTSVALYGLTILVINTIPTDQEKVVLKVRLQYRFNERYKSWMGLNDNGKGNFIFDNIGSELAPVKNQITHHLSLNEKEDLLFRGSEKNQTYLRYYADNLKEQNEDEKRIQIVGDSKDDQFLAQKSDPKKASGFLAIAMKTASSWIIFPLVFIFFLLDRGEIMHFTMRLVPNRYFELAFSVIRSVDEALGRYIRGTLIECALVGISLTIGFYLCGFDFQVAFLIGTIGGLTNAIPFLGTAIACILSAGYSLIVENAHPLIPFVTVDNLMLAVVAVVMVVHLLDNAVFQPLVVGKAVNLHPLVVILGVFGGSMMFGFAGLIFAIPTIVIITTVFKTFFLGLERYKII